MVVKLSKSEDEPAEARFLPRNKIDPFILCFQCMYDVACGTRILDKNLRGLTIAV